MGRPPPVTAPPMVVLDSRHLRADFRPVWQKTIQIPNLRQPDAVIHFAPTDGCFLLEPKMTLKTPGSDSGQCRLGRRRLHADIFSARWFSDALSQYTDYVFSRQRGRRTTVIRPWRPDYTRMLPSSPQRLFDLAEGRCFFGDKIVAACRSAGKYF